MAKILTGLLILAAALMAFVWWGRWHWAHFTQSLSEQVIRKKISSTEKVDFDELKNLPPPVQRYFRYALTDGQAMITKAYITQKGGFRAKPDQTDWSPMNAKQHFSTAPKAFIWNAEIQMLPALSVRVCDAYINGEAMMKVKLLSLYTVKDARNDKALDAGALQRYLAEAVWFPTGLLPSQGVVWEAIDDRRAKATMSDSGTTVSLEFEFNNKGEVVSVYTPARYREVNGHFKPTPWRGVFSQYALVDGYRIPMEGRVQWQLQDKIYPYWRAKIQKVVFMQ